MTDLFEAHPLLLNLNPTPSLRSIWGFNFHAVSDSNPHAIEDGTLS